MRYLILLLFLTSCEYSPDTGNPFHDKPLDSTVWRRFDYDGFAVRTPGNWVRYPVHATDGYVSGLTNGIDSLVLEYGSLSPSAGANGAARRMYAGAKIDGYPAIIGIPITPGQEECELEIYLSDRDRFYLGGHVRDTRMALAIFQALTFDKGHPQQTDSLSLARFSKGPPRTPENARALFAEHCAQCHSRNKVIIGPALSVEFLQKRSDQWLYRYITHRKKLPRDSLWRATSKEFNDTPCEEFPDLPQADVDLMLNWLRTAQPPGYDVVP